MPHPRAAAALLAICLLCPNSTWAQSAPSPCGDAVVVARGDTLSRIAERCDVSEALLLRANPGLSGSDDLRAGQARRMDKPGHLFGRIHRDDIAGAVLAAAQRHDAGAVRVLNLSDDEPASSADVVAEAARLLDMPPPPLVPFEAAEPGLSEMARSFWSENRRVSSTATQAALGLRWRFPTYQEGLRGILQQERAEGVA